VALARTSLGRRDTMRKPRQVVPAIITMLLGRLEDLGIFRDFYLAGGTGLALLLGHRRSVDLDLFSRTNRLDAAGRRSLLARLDRLPRWQVIEAKDGTVHGQAGSVRVSFFWYPEALVRPLVRRGRVRIASLEDLGLMKVGAIIGRGARKDFVDVYAICRQVPLGRLLLLGQKKFQASREFPLQALKALSFFEDAERDPPVVTSAPLAWEPVKRFFTREVRALTTRYLQ